MARAGTTLVTVAALLAALVPYAAAAGCVANQASCCPNVDYNVFGPLAGSACKGLEPVFKEVMNTVLKNATHECRSAYVDCACVTAIPECCSASNPTVFRPCRSLCESMMDKCGDAGHDLQDCSSSVWYDAPCNDGNGGGC